MQRAKIAKERGRIITGRESEYLGTNAGDWAGGMMQICRNFFLNASKFLYEIEASHWLRLRIEKVLEF